VVLLGLRPLNLNLSGRVDEPYLQERRRQCIRHDHAGCFLLHGEWHTAFYHLADITSELGLRPILSLKLWTRMALSPLTESTRVDLRSATTSNRRGHLHHIRFSHHRLHTPIFPSQIRRRTRSRQIPSWLIVAVRSRHASSPLLGGEHECLGSTGRDN